MKIAISSARYWYRPMRASHSGVVASSTASTSSGTGSTAAGRAGASSGGSKAESMALVMGLVFEGVRRAWTPDRCGVLIRSTIE